MELLQTAGAPALLGIVVVAAIAILALLIAGMAAILRKPAQSAEQQPAAKKTVDDIAIEVMAGLWGNDEERRQRLTAAGYDPEEVRVVVNQKIKERDGT